MGYCAFSTSRAPHDLDENIHLQGHNNHHYPSHSSNVTADALPPVPAACLLSASSHIPTSKPLPTTSAPILLFLRAARKPPVSSTKTGSRIRAIADRSPSINSLSWLGLTPSNSSSGCWEAEAQKGCKFDWVLLRW